MSKKCTTTIRFGALKHDTGWDEWVVKVYVNGKFSEGKTIRDQDKKDALDDMKASVEWAKGRGYCVVLPKGKKA